MYQDVLNISNHRFDRGAHQKLQPMKQGDKDVET